MAISFILAVAMMATNSPAALEGESANPAAVAAEATVSGTVLVFAAIIVGVFLLGFVLLVVPVIVRTLSLRRQYWLLKRVSRLPPEKLEYERSQIQPTLSKPKWSRQHWRIFLTTWQELFDRREGAAIRPVRMVEFFPPDRVLPGIANRRLATVLPGILVGLGILGTFTGLWSGLPSDTELTSAEQASAIDKLIAGLRLAFSTSLLGISASLVFMIADRLSFHLLEQTVRLTSRTAEVVFPYLPEAIALARAERTQNEIHANLQTLGTDIATALSNTMGDAIGAAMAKHITPSIDKLEQVIGELGNVVSEDMASVLQSFNKDLSQSIERRFGDFGDNIERMAESQEALHQNVSTFSAQLEAQTATQQKLAEQINAAAGSLQGVLGGLSSITQQLEGASARISVTSEALKASVDATLQSQKELISVQERLSQDLREDLQSLERTRTEVVESWKTVSDEARASIEIVQQSVRQLGEVVGDNLVKALDSFDAKLAEVIERFSGTLVETRETVNELPQLVQSLGENAQGLTDAFAAVRTSFEEVTSAVNSSVADSARRSKEAVERLAEIVREAMIVASKFEAAIKEADESRGQNVQAQTAQHLNELVTIARESRDHFAALRSGITSLAELRPSVERSEKLVGQLREQAAKALDGNLENALERLRHLESIERSLGQINGGLDSALSKLEGVSEKTPGASGSSGRKSWLPWGRRQ